VEGIITSFSCCDGINVGAEPFILLAFALVILLSLGVIVVILELVLERVLFVGDAASMLEGVEGDKLGCGLGLVSSIFRRVSAVLNRLRKMALPCP
jgi:hypothetical protein